MKFHLAPLAMLLLVTLHASASAQIFSDQIKGFTEPWRSIELAAPEMGTLSSIKVQEGEQVRAGETVAQLDDRVLQASLEMARKSHESTGKLNSAKAELRMHQTRHQKLQGLFQRRHASQTEIDRSQSQLEISAAQVEAVIDELNIKRLEMDRIKAQIEQRRLQSPIDGIATRVFKDEGEFVSANDPIVVKVVQLDPLRVTFSVPQKKARGLSAGSTIDVLMDDDQQRTTGTIEFVSPTADAQSGTARVKVRVENPEQQWVAGIACFLTAEAIEASAAQSLQTSTSELALRGE